MATVTIGGRQLDVKQTTLGMLKAQDRMAARAREAKSGSELADLIVEELLLYVGHNEGVTADWLLDHVQFRGGLAAVRAAAGQEPAPPGEAPRP